MTYLRPVIFHFLHTTGQLHLSHEFGEQFFPTLVSTQQTASCIIKKLIAATITHGNANMKNWQSKHLKVQFTSEKRLNIFAQMNRISISAHYRISYSIFTYLCLTSGCLLRSNILITLQSILFLSLYSRK